jgi:hypothetical protein
MPISQTVAGLLYERPCDSLNEGSSWYNADNFAWSIDSTIFKQGTGSLKLTGTSTGPQSSFKGGGWWEESPAAASAAPGNRIHIWHKSTDSNHTWYLCVYCPSCGAGNVPYPLYSTSVFTKAGTEDWTFRTGNLPSNFVGGPIYPQVVICTGSLGSTIADWVDHCVISLSQYVTVTGLSPGQIVEIFRASDNIQIDSETCAAGATSVALNVDAEDYPEYMYLKVYATDGATLIEVTANYIMCGGDTWQWTIPLGTLSILSNAYTIYRSGSSGSPQSATVTATLLTLAGAPYPNKTVNFWTSNGTVSPTSATTDANGNVQTTLTGSTQGIAVVKASWAGDASVPAAVAYATHHILYDLEVGDATKKFQLFIEGIEYQYSTGSYVLSDENTPQQFTVEIPQWLSTITRRGIVSIFRYGVKEYSGVLTAIERNLADPPHVTLTGLDSKSLMDTRVVTIKDYSAQTVQYIFNDLLTSFWCGVALGTVASYPSTITQTFADQSLSSAIAALCDILGWLYRVDTSNLLDLQPNFGSLKPAIQFVEGQNLFTNDYKIDDQQVCNSVRMRGANTLVSTQFDGASIENDDLGLLETVTFEKSIIDQNTLNIAAVAELAKLAGKNIAIEAEVNDDYPAGIWGLDDSVTLTIPEQGLSDTFQVVRIERDMTDPNYAKVDFLNKISLEWTDLYGQLHRELNDLGAKTNI